MPTSHNPNQWAPSQTSALERLIDKAHGDSGQASKIADFLLSWWNAKDYGGFDPTILWSVDAEIAADMIDVFQLIADARSYPDALGFREEFQALAKEWRS